LATGQKSPIARLQEAEGREGITVLRAVGDHYRALGQVTDDTIEWVWIGSHEEYNNL
jgi:hypothetical protein